MRQCRDCGRMVKHNATCVCVLIRGNPHTYVVIETYECILWEAVDSNKATGEKKEQSAKEGEKNDDE